MSRYLALPYRLYASAASLLVIFVLFCPLIIVMPGLALRRRIGRLCVHAALGAAFVRMHVRGQEHLPDGPAIVVANHASYLDGLVLTAALPPHYTFVVKQEAASWPYVGLVLRRMGVTFVDRAKARTGAAQTRALLKRLRKGDSLALFPEGTFHAKAGLLPFRRGAFVLAAHAKVPVIPATIHGTRRLFGEGQRLLRHSRVEIDFRAPLPPESGADALREAAHSAIAAACGESDLAATA